VTMFRFWIALSCQFFPPEVYHRLWNALHLQIISGHCNCGRREGGDLFMRSNYTTIWIN
jgi:hypothetical protein